MSKIIACCSILLVVGCFQVPTLFSNLNLIGGRYCLLNGKDVKQFTGETYLNYADGSISRSIKFKNGIPDGVSVFYGYQGEVTSTAEYLLLSKKDSSEHLPKEVLRINLVKSLEGSYEYYSLLVVCSTSNCKTNNLMVYIEGKLLPTIPNLKETKIKLCLGELETPFYTASAPLSNTKQTNN